jgi:hypothetical protein
MDYELDSWVDTEAQGILENIISSLEDRLHSDGCSHGVPDSRNNNTGGDAAVRLLTKQNMDMRAAAEESDEWKDWKDSFPHLR